MLTYRMGLPSSGSTLWGGTDSGPLVVVLPVSPSQWPSNRQLWGVLGAQKDLEKFPGTQLSMLCNVYTCNESDFGYCACMEHNYILAVCS